MAIYPAAIRQPLTVPNRAKNPILMPKPVRINFHTAVSNSTSIHPFFNSAGAKGVFSHFYVNRAGQVYQYQDTKYRASCDLDGNPDTISIETWDGYKTGYPGYWKGDSDVPPWNDAQIAALTALSRWILKNHPGIPARLAKDNRKGSSSHGFSWHRLGVVGAPGYIPPANGGLTYSTARGKVCPGARRTAQIPAILAAATATVSPSPSTPTTVGGLTMSDIKTILARLDTIPQETAAFPIHRSAGPTALIQELANQTAALASIQGQLAGLVAAIKPLAAGQGVDLSAVEAAAKRGAAEALKGASVTVELGA